MILMSYQNFYQASRAWTKFTKSDYLNYCRQYAVDAMKRRGSTILEASTYLVVGDKDATVASVSLVPLSNTSIYMIIRASSSALGLVKLERDAISDYIHKVVRMY